MRNRGLIYAKQRRNVAHTHITKRQAGDDLQTRKIGKILKIAGKASDLQVTWQERQNFAFSPLWKQQIFFHVSPFKVTLWAFAAYINTVNAIFALFYLAKEKKAKQYFDFFCPFKLKIVERRGQWIHKTFCWFCCCQSLQTQPTQTWTPTPTSCCCFCLPCQTVPASVAAQTPALVSAPDDFFKI